MEYRSLTCEEFEKVRAAIEKNIMDEFFKTKASLLGFNSADDVFEVYKILFENNLGIEMPYDRSLFGYHGITLQRKGLFKKKNLCNIKFMMLPTCEYYSCACALLFVYDDNCDEVLFGIVTDSIAPLGSDIRAVRSVNKSLFGNAAERLTMTLYDKNKSVVGEQSYGVESLHFHDNETLNAAKALLGKYYRA